MNAFPARRYAVEFGAAMTAYAAVLVLSIESLKAVGSSGWRYPLAVLPVAPLIVALWAVVRQVRRMDELQRRIQLEALAVSFAATTVITLSYGFLENAGLPRLSLIWVGPLMIAMWGLASCVAHRRYS